MVKYLNGLTHAFLRKRSVILYLSPYTITHYVWAPVIKNLITKKMVHFFCVDECHYITNAGRHFRPEFFINIRFIIGRLWNQCLMLFCPETMKRSSMYHTSLMLHPDSSINCIKDFTPDIGIDDCNVHIPTIDPLPSKCFTALIWGQVGWCGVDFVVDFTSKRRRSITVPLVEYTRHGCKTMGYCSSAADTRDTVKVGVHKILR